MTGKWDRLSLKKGYLVMREHGLSKPRSLFESVKGVKTFTISYIKR